MDTASQQRLMERNIYVKVYEYERGKFYRSLWGSSEISMQKGYFFNCHIGLLGKMQLFSSRKLCWKPVRTSCSTL